MKSAMFPTKLADSRFNLMDTAGAKAILGATGIKGFAAGESSKAGIEKSVADRVKMRAETAEKVAAKLAPSAGQNDEARKEARLEIRRQRQERLQQLEATKNAQKASADAMKEVEDLPRRLAAAEEHAATEKRYANDGMTASADALRRGTIDQAQHQADMTRERARIERASDAVNTIQQRIDVLDAPVKAAEQEVRNYDNETERRAKEAGTQIVDAMRDSALDI